MLYLGNYQTSNNLNVHNALILTISGIQKKIISSATEAYLVDYLSARTNVKSYGKL